MLKQFVSFFGEQPRGLPLVADARFGISHIVVQPKSAVRNYGVSIIYFFKLNAILTWKYWKIERILT
jgi:hypothetical protein